MRESVDSPDPVPAEIFVLLERHLPHFTQLETLLTGSHLEFGSRTAQWLEAILDEPEALSFASESVAHLFASLIMFVRNQSSSSESQFGSDSLERSVRSAASIAKVCPNDIRKRLWPADRSLRETAQFRSVL